MATLKHATLLIAAMLFCRIANLGYEQSIRHDILENIPLGPIWTRYFKILQAECHPVSDHFYATKPNSQRGTKNELIVKSLRKQKEPIKKNQKSAIDNAQSGSTHVITEQDLIIWNRDSVKNEPVMHCDCEDSDVYDSSEFGSG